MKSKGKGMVFLIEVILNFSSKPELLTKVVKDGLEEGGILQKIWAKVLLRMNQAVGVLCELLTNHMLI